MFAARLHTLERTDPVRWAIESMRVGVSEQVVARALATHADHHDAVFLEILATLPPSLRHLCWTARGADFYEGPKFDRKVVLHSAGTGYKHMRYYVGLGTQIIGMCEYWSPHRHKVWIVGQEPFQFDLTPLQFDLTGRYDFAAGRIERVLNQEDRSVDPCLDDPTDWEDGRGFPDLDGEAPFSGYSRIEIPLPTGVFLPYAPPREGSRIRESVTVSQDLVIEYLAGIGVLATDVQIEVQAMDYFDDGPYFKVTLLFHTGGKAYTAYRIGYATFAHMVYEMCLSFLELTD